MEPSLFECVYNNALGTNLFRNGNIACYSEIVPSQDVRACHDVEAGAGCRQGNWQVRSGRGERPSHWDGFLHGEDDLTMCMNMHE